MSQKFCSSLQGGQKPSVRRTGEGYNGNGMSEKLSGAETTSGGSFLRIRWRSRWLRRIYRRAHSCLFSDGGDLRHSRRRSGKLWVRDRNTPRSGQLAYLTIRCFSEASNLGGRGKTVGCCLRIRQRKKSFRCCFLMWPFAMHWLFRTRSKSLLVSYWRQASLMAVPVPLSATPRLRVKGIKV